MDLYERIKRIEVKDKRDTAKAIEKANKTREKALEKAHKRLMAQKHADAIAKAKLFKEQSPLGRAKAYEKKRKGKALLTKVKRHTKYETGVGKVLTGIFSFANPKGKPRRRVRR
jgi:hypothetical protein